LKLGYLQQHDPFLPGETVREFLMRGRGHPIGAAARWPGNSVPDAMVDQPFRELSRRLANKDQAGLAAASRSNLLILDEPTNFLDLRTQMLLERFLSEFRAGCLIGPRPEFLKRTCTAHARARARQLTLFPGNGTLIGKCRGTQ